MGINGLMLSGRRRGPAQFARPDSTVDAWDTGSFLDLDETSPNDSDLATLAVDEIVVPTNQAENGLSNVTDPVASFGHIIRVRAKWSGLQQTGGAVARLVQGSTVKATTPSFDLGTENVWVTNVYTLTGAEADSITDYTDLRLRVQAFADTGDDWVLSVSWMELEVPGTLL